MLHPLNITFRDKQTGGDLHHVYWLVLSAINKQYAVCIFPNQLFENGALSQISHNGIALSLGFMWLLLQESSL